MEENETPLEDTNDNSTNGVPAENDFTNTGSTPAENDMTDNTNSDTTNTGESSPLGDFSSGVPVGDDNTSTDEGSPLGDSLNNPGIEPQSERPRLQKSTLHPKKVYKDCKIISIMVTGF